MNARPINSSSIEVSWDPPIDKDKNGVIRGYQIHVQPKNMVRLSRGCCVAVVVVAVVVVVVVVVGILQFVVVHFTKVIVEAVAIV